MSKITSILGSWPEAFPRAKGADFVCPLIWEGPQPSDSMAQRHLITTVACVANLSGAQHPDKMATALIVGLCLPLEVG